MKRSLILGVTLLAALEIGPAAMTNEPIGIRTLALVVASDVDPAFSARLAQFLGHSFRTRVEFRSADMPAGSISSCATMVATSGEGRSAVALGVISLTESNYSGLVSSATGSVAILNASALRVSGVSNAAAVERFNRRIEKESVAALARVMGLRACPNPGCALFPHQNETELDQKGRVLCPPCQMKAEQAMHGLGMIQLQPELIHSAGRSTAL